MPEPTIRGACLCGAVRLVVAGAPRFVAHCHCASCRKAHGAGFATFAGYPAEALAIEDPDGLLARYVQTDTGSSRRFCSHCGSPLVFDGPRWEGEVHVVLAVLEHVPAPPKGHAYADRAPAWCPITDDLPRFGGPDGTTPL